MRAYIDYVNTSTDQQHELPHDAHVGLICKMYCLHRILDDLIQNLAACGLLHTLDTLTLASKKFHTFRFIRQISYFYFSYYGV